MAVSSIQLHTCAGPRFAPGSARVGTEHDDSARSAAIILLCAGVSGAELDLTSLDTKLNQIARTARAEVGVSLVHVESGARLSIQGGQPFPMASVYKLPIALELLTQVADGTLTLDRQVTLGPSDIRACCTLSRRHPKGGVTLGVHELLELMITESDNTAGDALMKIVGGPGRGRAAHERVGIQDDSRQPL